MGSRLVGSSLVGCKLEAREKQVKNILVILTTINTITMRSLWRIILVVSHIKVFTSYIIC